jgi:hypothetical protein
VAAKKHLKTKKKPDIHSSSQVPMDPFCKALFEKSKVEKKTQRGISKKISRLSRLYSESKLTETTTRSHYEAKIRHMNRELKSSKRKSSSLSKSISRALKKGRLTQLGIAINGINYRTPTGKVWEIIGKLQGDEKGKSNATKVHPIVKRGLDAGNGGIIKEASEVANALADHYTKTCSPLASNDMIQIETDIGQRNHGVGMDVDKQSLFVHRERTRVAAWKSSLEKHLFTPATPSECKPLPTEGHNSAFSWPEIMANYPRGDSINSSPGPDGVCNRLIRLGGVVLAKVLTQLGNLMLMQGYFPRIWKIPAVAALPKDTSNRKPIKATRTRPISLLCCLSKVFERVLDKRLKAVMEGRKQSFSPRQTGFRSAHRTEDLLIRLAHFIRKTWSNEGAVIIIQLDAYKAYDKVWKPDVENQVVNILGDGQTAKLILSFLEDRSSFIKLGKTTSRLYQNKSGIPQGSSISPTLYICNVNEELAIIDRFEKEHSGIDGGAFADDLVLALAIPDPRRECSGLLEEGSPLQMHHQTKVFQRLLDEITITAAAKGRHYFATLDTVNGSVVLSPSYARARDSKREMEKDKRSLMFIPPLYLGGNLIAPTTKSLKLLGITLDYQLEFTEHIHSLHKRMKSRYHVIRKLGSSYWNADPVSMANLWKAWAEPIVRYGSTVWAYSSPKLLKLLDHVQAAAARAIIAAEFTAARLTSLDEAGLVPLQIQRLTDAAAYYNRMLRLPPRHLTAIMRDEWLAERDADRKERGDTSLIDDNIEIWWDIQLNNVALDSDSKHSRAFQRQRSLTSPLEFGMQVSNALWLNEATIGPPEQIPIFKPRIPWCREDPQLGITPPYDFSQPEIPVLGAATSRTNMQKKMAAVYSRELDKHLRQRYGAEGWIISTDGSCRRAYANSIIRPYSWGWSSDLLQLNKDPLLKLPGKSFFGDRAAGAGATIWSQITCSDIKDGKEDDGSNSDEDDEIEGINRFTTSGFFYQESFPLGRFHTSSSAELMAIILVLEAILAQSNRTSNSRNQTYNIRGRLLQHKITEIGIVTDNQYVWNSLRSKGQKHQPMATPILDGYHSIFARWRKAHDQVNLLLIANTDSSRDNTVSSDEERINYFWVPGHTDEDGKEDEEVDEELDEEDDLKVVVSGCFEGNIFADHLAERATDMVVEFGLKNSLMVTADGSHQMGIPLRAIKSEIKRRTTILYRSLRFRHFSDDNNKSVSDKAYLAKNIFWEGNTFNWCIPGGHWKNPEILGSLLEEYSQQQQINGLAPGNGNGNARVAGIPQGQGNGEDDDIDFRFSKENRWNACPRAFKTLKNRYWQTLLHRIRLGCAPTRDVLCRRFRGLYDNNSCPKCNQPDSSNHRLFACQAFRAFRLDLAGDIREILRLGEHESTRRMSDEQVIASFFNWPIFLTHSYHSLPPDLSILVKNFRIDPRVCDRLTRLFIRFVFSSGLDRLFSRRSRIMDVVDKRRKVLSRAARLRKLAEQAAAEGLAAIPGDIFDSVFALFQASSSRSRSNLQLNADDGRWLLSALQGLGVPNTNITLFLHRMELAQKRLGVAIVVLNGDGVT